MTQPPEASPARHSLARHLRRTLLSGMAVLLPLVITLWLLAALFHLVNGNVTPWVQRLFRLTGIRLFFNPAFMLYVTPLIGLVLTAAVIYLAGLLSTNLFGAKILAGFDHLMLRIPVVRAIYGGSKQLMDALSPKGTRTFTQVVLVEYPRKGVYTVAFVTRERLAPELVPDQEAGPMATVFLPTTPNPTSGWMLVVPQRELIPLPLTVEEGVKLVVSGGIVIPERGLPASSFGPSPRPPSSPE